MNVSRITGVAYNGDNLGGLIGESVGKFLVERYQVCHVYIEDVSLNEDIRSQGISRRTCERRRIYQRLGTHR